VLLAAEKLQADPGRGIWLMDDLCRKNWRGQVELVAQGWCDERAPAEHRLKDVTPYRSPRSLCVREARPCGSRLP
jgi:hypothetical protein